MISLACKNQIDILNIFVSGGIVWFCFLICKSNEIISTFFFWPLETEIAWCWHEGIYKQVNLNAFS